MACVNRFPAFPRGIKGRRRELDILARLVTPPGRGRLVLVGGGGTGKSMLACALGHRTKRSFPGGLHWFRSGSWDARTIAEMLALRFGTTRGRSGILGGLRRHLAARGPAFIVLDNHENDSAVAAVLNALTSAPVTWVITARRCLLGGVHVHPVVAPLAATGEEPFPRVRSLGPMLRYSPLAMDVADALVDSGAIETGDLRTWLRSRGIERVCVVDHEDDLPEVRLLVDWAWPKLPSSTRKLLAVLAHMGGDHMDAESLGWLARIRGTDIVASLRSALSWHLVQEVLPGRYALHATIRHAMRKRTRGDPERYFDYYVTLLERAPDRHDLEQTHLYSAMDFAHSSGRIDWILRIERLVTRLGDDR